jgi:hypothetical protein
LGEFGEPILIAELADEAWSHSPTLTADRREMIFVSTRGGGDGFEDLWVMTRDSTDDPFGPPQHLPELNELGFDSAPGISADGLTLMYSSFRAGSGDFDMYATQRRLRLDHVVVGAAVLHVHQQKLGTGRLRDLRQCRREKVPAEGAEHRLAGEEFFLDWVVSHFSLNL